MRNSKNIFGFFVVVLCVLVFNATNVQAATNEKRLGGTDRYDTSVKISADNWTQSDNIILVSGRDFPDALSAAPLSKKLDAPILLTEPKAIPSNILTEIQRLKAKNAYIVGGTGVVDPIVENTLKVLGIKVTRIAGKDRYETSIEVAKQLGSVNSAVIASGDSFADALCMAPIAAVKQMPILLTEKDKLTDSVSKYIAANNIQQGYIVGGTGVVSDNAASKLSGFKRLCGVDRFATNLAIINEFINDLTYNNVFVATGYDFPDALSGSAAAAKLNAPIFLTDGKVQLSDPTLLIKLKVITSLKVLGATGAVPETGVQKIVSNVIFNEIFEYNSYTNPLQYYIDRQVAQGTNVNFGVGTATPDQVSYYMNPTNFITDAQGKYMFLKLNYRDGITVDDLNKILTNRGVLSGKGQTFLTAGQKYNVNPIYLVAHALLETGNGSSQLATGILVSSVDGQPVTPKTVYNAYGVGAIDSDANKYGSEYAYKQGWFTIDDAIIGGAQFISSGYINSTRQQDTLYKMKWDLTDIWHEYATDVGWAYKQTSIIKQLAAQTQNSVFYFEIPVFK